MKKLSLLLLFLLTAIPVSSQTGGPGGGISSPYASRRRPILFAALGTPANGTFYYCTNCNANTSPCTTGGTGANADRVNGAWICSTAGSAGTGTVTSVGLVGTANQITVTGTSPITASGSWTLSFPAGGVTLPGTTTGTFSGSGASLTSIPESGVTNLTTDLSGKQASGNYITALTGNVAASGPGSVAATIQPGVVTSAMLNITTTTCTNQFLSAVSSGAVGTCTAFTLAAFPTQATNTVLGNATSGTAVPTALAVSTCSGASNALNWTTNTGFGCNGSITANTSTTATTATNATNTAITDDTTTNATMFPTWVSTASGNQAQSVSSTLLTFNPSTSNFAIGSTPSATAGERLVVTDNFNGTTVIRASNPDATDTGAIASLEAKASTGVGRLLSHGAGRTATRLGVTLANYSELTTAISGLLLSTTNAIPIIAGTNSTRALTIDGTSQAVSLRGTQTNDNPVAGDLGEFTNAQCPGPTTTATITVTIASPGVVTWSSHPFSGTAPRFDACPVVFTTGGSLPTGITASTTYWVVPTTISGNNFSIATSVANAIAGTTINTSGSQSGTHTGTAGSVLTTATAKDVTGLALTAGDWDCSALLARGLGGTTSVTLLKTSISTTSATDGTVPAGTMNQFAQAASVPANDVDESIGPLRLLNSGTTNTFLVADDTFTLSTNKAYGTIRCRRMR